MTNAARSVVDFTPHGEAIKYPDFDDDTYTHIDTPGNRLVAVSNPSELTVFDHRDLTSGREWKYGFEATCEDGTLKLLIRTRYIDDTSPYKNWREVLANTPRHPDIRPTELLGIAIKHFRAQNNPPLRIEGDWQAEPAGWTTNLSIYREELARLRALQGSERVLRPEFEAARRTPTGKMCACVGFTAVESVSDDGGNVRVLYVPESAEI